MGFGWDESDQPSMDHEPPDDTELEEWIRWLLAGCDPVALLLGCLELLDRSATPGRLWQQAGGLDIASRPPPAARARWLKPRRTMRVITLPGYRLLSVQPARQPLLRIR